MNIFNKMLIILCVLNICTKIMRLNQVFILFLFDKSDMREFSGNKEYVLDKEKKSFFFWGNCYRMENCRFDLRTFMNEIKFHFKLSNF